MDGEGGPEVSDLVDEGFHEVDLGVGSGSTGPPCVSRVVIVPLQFDLAIVYDEGEGLCDLLGLLESFLELVDGETVEGEKGVHDAVCFSELFIRPVHRGERNMGDSRIVFVGQQDIAGLRKVPPGSVSPASQILAKSLEYVSPKPEFWR
jgi:hypothetical protein